MSMRLDRVLFPGGREKAVTFSFDDAVVEDREVVNLFNRFHLKATFNINAGCFEKRDRMPIPEREFYHTVLPEAEITALYEGHEIAAHGFKHWSMTDSPEDNALADALLCRAALEKLTGKQVRGYAYPYGHYDANSEELLKKAGIRYSRTVIDSDTFDLTNDFMKWNPTCHFLDPKRDRLLDEFIGLEVTPYNPAPKLFYIWGHGYELTIEDAWQDWESFLEKVANRPEIWYATNMEIVAYMDAVKRLEYSLDRSSIYNPSAQAVWMRLDDEVTELPGGQLWRSAN